MILLALQLARADCGDGTVESGESCDDANAVAGDGCSDACAVEAGWTCTESAVVADFTEDMADDLDTDNVAAVWTEAGGTVTQTESAVPSVYLLDLDAEFAAVRFELAVTTEDSNDFVGWVVGFDPGEGSSSSADWLLFDWKQDDEEETPCTIASGLAVSLVSDVFTSTDEACRTGSVAELARATTLGATAWADNTTYTVEMVYSSSQLEVWVDGTLEFSESGSFPTGNVGFYQYSQQDVSFTLLDPTLWSTCTPDEVEPGDDTGDTGDDPEDTGADTGDTGDDPADTGGDTADDPEDTGGDTGDTGDDPGDSGDSGSDTGDTAVDSPDTGTHESTGNPPAWEPGRFLGGCGSCAGGFPALPMLVAGLLLRRRLSPAGAKPPPPWPSPARGRGWPKAG